MAGDDHYGDVPVFERIAVFIADEKIVRIHQSGREPFRRRAVDTPAMCTWGGISNIKTAYARAKAHGAITVSAGGIVKYHKGLAALIRDPDVGGYIVLWQPAP